MYPKKDRVLTLLDACIEAIRQDLTDGKLDTFLLD